MRRHLASADGPVSPRALAVAASITIYLLVLLVVLAITGALP